MGEAKQILRLNNLQDTYWGKRIILAEEYSSEFIEEDKKRAGSWTTCACGKLDDGIPRRDGDGIWPYGPKDEKLFDLGVHFYYCIKADNVVGAAKLLVSIECRAAEVLAETNSRGDRNED